MTAEFKKNIVPAIFLHIQKTAGTTIVELAQKYYGKENVVSHADCIVGHGLFSAGEFITYSDSEIKAAKEFEGVPFISGHFGFDYAKQFIDERFSFTFLRDPIDRVLSFYNFCRTRNPKEYRIYELAQSLSLEEFLELGLNNDEVKAFIWNNQAWQLASGVSDTNWRDTLNVAPKTILATALENIEALSYIGFTETFEKDRDHILQSLGMPVPRERIVTNSSFWSPESAGVTPKAKDLLYELTELDRNIYEAVWLRSNSPSRTYVEINKEYNLESDFSSADIDKTRNYYLSLLQQCLTGSIYGDASFAPFGSRTFDQRLREHGLDWPERAQTMVGDKRLANLRELISIILDENVPGDLIETGVWRGGSCILMRAVLMSYGITDRKIWVADSFEGLPKGDESLYPADRGSDFHSYPQLAISLEDVRNNFSKYGLLDDQVVFLKGWFKDTLPTAPINSLALIRLDGDMYESTMDGLVNLYPKLSVGGYVIVDDYHVVPACKLAVHDYFMRSGISPELVEIDGVGVYWKKIGTLPLRTTESSLKNNILNAGPDDRLNDALVRLNRIVISELHVSLVKRDMYLAKLENQDLNLRQQLAKREISLLNLTNQLEESIEIVSKIHESYSWAVTAPLRKLSSAFRKLGIIK